jgi:micrococcal nuclease
MSYIDAPETKQPFGKESKEYLARLLVNEPLQLTIKGHDRYGRILAIVRTQRVPNVNELMVEKGYAWWYLPGKALKATYMPLQKYARSKKAGIWKQKQPTPPWIFRKQSK